MAEDKLTIVNRGLQKIGAKRLVSLTENTRERLAIDACYDTLVRQELMSNFWTFAIRRSEIPADGYSYAASAVVTAGGTGYILGEIITDNGGGVGTPAQFVITGVAAGVVTSVEVTEVRGEYTTTPTNPIATTGGSGTGCTLTVTYETAPRFGRSYAFTQPSDYLRAAPKDPHDAFLYNTWLFEGKKILADEPGPLQVRYVSDLSHETTKEDLFHPLFANALAMRIAVETVEELTGSATKGEAAESAYTYFVNLARRIDAIEAGPIEPEIDEFVAVRISRGTDPTLRKYS